MCEALDPPCPGDPLFLLWRGGCVPVEGEDVEVVWGGHTLTCRVDKALPSKAFDGEPRRLHLTVVG